MASDKELQRRMEGCICGLAIYGGSLGLRFDPGQPAQAEADLSHPVYALAQGILDRYCLNHDRKKGTAEWEDTFFALSRRTATDGLPKAAEQEGDDLVYGLHRFTREANPPLDGDALELCCQAMHFAIEELGLARYNGAYGRMLTDVVEKALEALVPQEQSIVFSYLDVYGTRNYEAYVPGFVQDEYAAAGHEAVLEMMESDRAVALLIHTSTYNFGHGESVDAAERHVELLELTGTEILSRNSMNHLEDNTLTLYREECQELEDEEADEGITFS